MHAQCPLDTFCKHYFAICIFDRISFKYDLQMFLYIYYKGTGISSRNLSQLNIFAKWINKKFQDKSNHGWYGISLCHDQISRKLGGRTMQNILWCLSTLHSTSLEDIFNFILKQGRSLTYPPSKRQSVNHHKQSYHIESGILPSYLGSSTILFVCNQVDANGLQTSQFIQ